MQYYGYFQYHRMSKRFPKLGISDSMDFTIVCCTLGTESSYLTNVRSWLACKPHKLIIATIHERLPDLQNLANALADQQVHIISVPRPDWRQQACEAVRHVTTPYVVFVDDRVRWRPEMLQHLASGFGDPAVGGITTAERLVPQGARFTIWESFGALNLVRRNILHSYLAYFGNGNVLNLAGRTSGFRTHIIQQDRFYHAFQKDLWRGKYILRTGNDNFLTSWILRQGWKTQFLIHEKATVLAKVNADRSYLRQLMRWSRDTAKYYLRDLGFAIKTNDRMLLRKCIAKIGANYTSDFALVAEVGCLLIITLVRKPLNDKGVHPELSVSLNAIWSWAPLTNESRPPTTTLWLQHFLFTGIFQVFEHGPLFTSLHNFNYIPGAILYSYIHATIVILAMLSLEIVSLNKLLNKKRKSYR